MKFLVAVAVLVACAAADVSKLEATAPIVRQAYDITPEGNFQYSYETGNGISAQAVGTLKNINTDYPALEIKGDVKYTDPLGEAIGLTYIADENGYRATGSHIPVPPPIPEWIVRSLEYIAAHPPVVAKVN